MPISLCRPIRRLSQREFGDLAYVVMSHVFQIHDEFGRLFDEAIYKRELACQFPGVELEVPIQITHQSFQTTHYFDVLVDNGGPFEFKTVEALAPYHTAQLLHYLLLTGLAHGKLVNLRNESVEHEFVNTSLHYDDRVNFAVIDPQWNGSINGAEHFRAILTEILRDWGTGLDLELYHKAMAHFLGNRCNVCSEVEVRMGARSLGKQRVQLAAPRVAYILTALPHGHSKYQSQLHRLHRHTNLEAILWANISLKCVTFTSII